LCFFTNANNKSALLCIEGVRGMHNIHVMLPQQKDLKERICADLDASAVPYSPVGDIFEQEHIRALGVCYQQVASGMGSTVLFVSDPTRVLLHVANIPGVRPTTVLSDDLREIRQFYNCFLVEDQAPGPLRRAVLAKIAALVAPSFGTLERCVSREWVRQQWSLDCIASESTASEQVCQMQGSILTNKYAEGYPGARYYGGCAVVDEVERLAQKRAARLFGCRFANVQPHSGSQANQGVYTGLLDPGDTILGMALSHGGHLTHGYPISATGRVYQGVSYHVCRDTGLIDYDEVERLAQQHKPKLIIAGASAYPRVIDYARFRSIADSVGAYLLADIAHVAGLMAAKILPGPFPHAHVVTSTNHKTLRGPRGGFILCDEEDVFKRINRGVFPGLQGGPLMHVIAAKAQAFQEAGTMHHQRLMKRVVAGAQKLAEVLMDAGFVVLTGGTDNHKVLVDLRNKNITGQEAEDVLASYNIVINKNMVPFDTAKPMNPSGMRLGTVALACRGWDVPEFEQLGGIVTQIIEAYGKKPVTNLHQKIRTLCERFPIAS